MKGEDTHARRAPEIRRRPHPLKFIRRRGGVPCNSRAASAYEARRCSVAREEGSLAFAEFSKWRVLFPNFRFLPLQGPWQQPDAARTVTVQRRMRLIGPHASRLPSVSFSHCVTPRLSNILWVNTTDSSWLLLITLRVHTWESAPGVKELPRKQCLRRGPEEEVSSSVCKTSL